VSELENVVGEAILGLFIGSVAGIVLGSIGAFIWILLK